MKTLTKTLFATVLTAIVLVSAASTTFAARKINESTKLTLSKPGLSVAGVNKIWASGNVKVILTQSERKELLQARISMLSPLSSNAKEILFTSIPLKAIRLRSLYQLKTFSG